MTTKDYLSKNITMLLEYNGWTRKQLANKAGISDRMVTYIINQERAATIEVAENIGKAFGINGWLMISPHLTIDSYRKIDRLNSHYAASSDQAREYIDMIAERESQYKA